MKLNQKKYTEIEYTTDDEFGLIGRITMDDNKFVGAEITDSYIMSTTELNNVRKFLNDVEMMMKENIIKDYEVGVVKDTVKGFIRCE